MFHEQDWGGFIEAETRPIRRSYVDDRFELFGKDAIVEYVDAMTGGPAWDTVRDRDRIDLVWLRPDRGLAKRLLKEPGWSVLYRDKVSILFSRRAGDIKTEGDWSCRAKAFGRLGPGLELRSNGLDQLVRQGNRPLVDLARPRPRGDPGHRAASRIPRPRYPTHCHWRETAGFRWAADRRC